MQPTSLKIFLECTGLLADALLCGIATEHLDLPHVLQLNASICCDSSSLCVSIAVDAGVAELEWFCQAGGGALRLHDALRRLATRRRHDRDADVYEVRPPGQEGEFVEVLYTVSLEFG